MNICIAWGDITTPRDWVSEARPSLTSLNGDLGTWQQSSKRSMRVHPGRILQNVNISAGARNSGQKDLKIIPGKKNNSKELWRKNRRDIRS